MIRVVLTIILPFVAEYRNQKMYVVRHYDVGVDVDFVVKAV